MPHRPSTAGGKFVKCQPQASLMASVVPSEPSSNTLMMPPPPNLPSHIPNTMSLMQLVSATDEINIHQASPLAQQEGSAVLMSIADVLPCIINNLTTPSEPSIHTAVSDHPSSTDLGHAINLSPCQAHSSK